MRTKPEDDVEIEVANRDLRGLDSIAKGVIRKGLRESHAQYVCILVYGDVIIVMIMNFRPCDEWIYYQV